ncbi:hypothetical protein [Shouchella patagoniensis]|uniref:hypothetical protein n=1 Tax=Shouchella patagoniensis TaxID=228576 RepID=UPI0009955016|nr:hypothetical protein [Shouchella patagoniensis]
MDNLSLKEKRIELNQIAPEPNWQEGTLEAFKGIETSIYAAVFFYLGKKERLELRIRRIAFETEPTGIGTVDIYNWLYEVGKSFVGEMKGRRILLIESTDVEEGHLQTHWTELTEIPQDLEEETE